MTSRAAGPASGATGVPALVAHQVRYEQKNYWRSPQSAFFTFAFPIMFLVIFASLNKGARIKELDDISFNQYYIPSIMAFGLMSACYTNLAIALATRRDEGILKRLRATPLPNWAMFAGLTGNALVTSSILVVLTLGVGVAGYDVHPPYHVLPLVVALLLGVVAFCALGVAVSALVPTAEAAPAIVNFPFFLLTFVSGTFFHVPEGSTLVRIADAFPLIHLNRAVFAPFDPTAHGGGWRWHDLLVLALWAAGGTVVAVRRFRWEPRRS
ncbi:MAG: ABC transporter permease [Frankiaceae bacterium]